MHLDNARAVFQRILFLNGPVGQLAGLAHRDEAHPHRQGDRRPEDEAARLDAHDDVGRTRLRPLDHTVDDFLKGWAVRQHRRDVLEDDPRLGKVGDVADQFMGQQVRQNVTGAP